MEKLHEELHVLKDSLIDIRTVLEVSEKLMRERDQKHIHLITTSMQKLNEIQKQIDEIFIKKDVDLSETDSGGV